MATEQIRVRNVYYIIIIIMLTINMLRIIRFVTCQQSFGLKYKIKKTRTFFHRLVEYFTQLKKKKKIQ